MLLECTDVDGKASNYDINANILKYNRANDERSIVYIGRWVLTSREDVKRIDVPSCRSLLETEERVSSSGFQHAASRSLHQLSLMKYINILSFTAVLFLCLRRTWG